MSTRFNVCDTIGEEDGRFGIGVGEPCENDATHVFMEWCFCKDCYNRLMRHRTNRGWGKPRGEDKE